MLKKRNKGRGIKTKPYLNNIKLPEFWEKIEHYNSKIISPALIILLFIIIYELFLHIENYALELAVHIMDYLVIAVFVIDLIFLAVHSKNTRFFFKSYWLDILAVFPFVLFFSVINRVYRAVIATERFVVGQAIFHETLEAGKSTKILAKTGRFTKIGARMLRVIAKSHFFSKIMHHSNRHQKRTKRLINS